MSDNNQDTQETSTPALLYRLATGTSITLALLTFAVSVLLLGNYVQYRLTDPLNSPALVELRHRFSEDTANEQLKQDIRRLDLLARKAFFNSQSQLRIGGMILLACVIALVLTLNGIAGLRKTLPDPSGCPGLDTVWETVLEKRKAMGIAATTLIVAAVAAGFAAHSALTPNMVRHEEPVPPDTTDSDADPTSGDTTVVSPAPVPAAEQCASFRGAGGSGFFAVPDVPTTWDEETGENILWKVPIPLRGLSSPIVWGDRIYVTGATRQQREVYCFQASDGALLWTGRYTSDPNASQDYDVYDSPGDFMHAAPTPTTDGSRVYALFANGELVAFSASTGQHLWTRVLGDTVDNLYGLSGSLIAYEQSVIAPFDGDARLLYRIDGATGDDVWVKERNEYTWASPILVTTSNGEQRVITHGDPETTAWDAETGDQVWGVETCSGDIAPSPIFTSNRVFVVFSGCGLFALDIKDGSEIWTLEEFEEGAFSETPSMTTDGTLLYHFYDTILGVVHAADGTVAYEQELDTGATYASPFVVNDNVYLVCGETIVVIKTGTAFTIVAENILQEKCSASPAVVQGRLYIRTTDHLYCIGKD